MLSTKDSNPGAIRTFRRWLAPLAAGVALLLPGFVWLASGSESVRNLLRARVSGELAARCPGAMLVGDVRVDALFRLVLGPIVVPSRTAGAPPLLAIDRTTVRPRLLALLNGRVEAASVTLDGVRVEGGSKGEALAELAHACDSGRIRRSNRTASGPVRAVTLAFSRSFVTFGQAADAGALAADLGPFAGRATLGRDGAEATARIDFQMPVTGGGVVHVRWGAGRGALGANLRGLVPASLPEIWRARLPIDSTAGSLDLDVDAPTLTASGAGEARIQGVLRGLELRSDRLAPGLVGPITLRLTATARWDLRAGSLELDQARIGLGDGAHVSAPLRVALATRPEPWIEMETAASALDWDALLAALPPALAPPPEAPAVRGTLKVHLALSGPVRRPEAWRIDGDVDPAALEAAPAQPGALDLARPFTWEGRLPDGRTRKVVVGPQNPAFVPVDALPAHVVRAVLTSEDAGFYGHHGFDLSEIQDALARSSERRLRGASTITQQIAKNLFLSLERTYVRKIREALATVALETSVGKRRLLEIYLNVAEWGPGVFGIGEAARHWFGKDARDLTPKEAAFLATVIPNPIRYEMYRRRGALTETWEDRVRGLLVKLRAADVISEEQLQEAWTAHTVLAGGLRSDGRDRLQ